MDILIVTGMSGAGKTFVGNVLEDFGFYCIDNIPVQLIPQFIELYRKQEEQNQKIALVVDVRGCDDFSILIKTFDIIREKIAERCRLMYLDASTEVLINRYKETRHIHPLVQYQSIPLEMAIEKEREMLSEVKQKADFLIDTSSMSLAVCREKIISTISDVDSAKIKISFVSFGFKYGIPTDSDLLFDVRCFPNPYYIDELKHHTGLEACVSDYVKSFASTKTFLENLFKLLDQLVPLYLDDGRSHLTISIGCTGGKHRSVTVVEELKKHFSDNPICHPTVAHRDINR